MRVEETQLLEYINYKVLSEAKKGNAMGKKWIGTNVHFKPCELKEEGWIAEPQIDSYFSDDREAIIEYAKDHGWRTYQVELIEDILKTFE